MKKILVKLDLETNDFKIVCDCTGMETREDALACITSLYKDVYSDDRLTEIATSLAEEGEWQEDDWEAFKVIDISSLENPLEKKSKKTSC